MIANLILEELSYSSSDIQQELKIRYGVVAELQDIETVLEVLEIENLEKEVYYNCSIEFPEDF